MELLRNRTKIAFKLNFLVSESITKPLNKGSMTLKRVFPRMPIDDSTNLQHKCNARILH